MDALAKNIDEDTLALLGQQSKLDFCTLRMECFSSCMQDTIKLTQSATGKFQARENFPQKEFAAFEVCSLVPEQNMILFTLI